MFLLVLGRASSTRTGQDWSLSDWVSGGFTFVHYMGNSIQCAGGKAQLVASRC